MWLKASLSSIQTLFQKPQSSTRGTSCSSRENIFWLKNSQKSPIFSLFNPALYFIMSQNLISTESKLGFLSVSYLIHLVFYLKKAYLVRYKNAKNSTWLFICVFAHISVTHSFSLMCFLIILALEMCENYCFIAS